MDPFSSVAVEPKPHNASFRPGEHPVRSVGPARIEVDVLAIYLDQHDIRIEFSALHQVGIEKVLSSVGNPAPIGFKSRGPRQSKKEPCQLDTIAIASLPDIFNVRGLFFLVAFLFLLGLANLVRGIAKFLYAVVYFSELYLWRVGR